MNRAPGWPPVTEIAGQVLSGKRRAVDQVAQAITAASALGTGSGLATLMAPRARATATALDAAIDAGEEAGPLAGVPIAVKDNITVAGHVPDDLARFGQARPPDRDAPCLRRLARAGGVVVGTTQMAEWAMGVTGTNPHRATLDHPHAPGRVPGGSSSGSAVAVAKGVVAVALGTDTGGSVRIPAALCGIVGFRPSHGLIDADGVLPVSPTFDRVGVLARRVADVVPVVAAMSDLVPEVVPSATGLRIGVVGEAMAAVPDRRLGAVFRDAVARLAAWGAHVGAAGLPRWADAAAACRTIVHVEAAAVHADRLACFPERFGLDVGRRLAAGRDTPARDRTAAGELLGAWREALDGAFAQWDLLVAPTCAIGAPLAAQGTPTALVDALSSATYAVSAGGCPALSVPCGVGPDGLALGLQLVAPVGADGWLLAAAVALEPALSAW